MKRSVRHICIFAALVMALAAPLQAVAQISPIRIKVDVTGRMNIDRKKPPKKGGVIPKSTVIEEKQLEITLANGTPNDYKGLTVKYYIFVSDVGSREILIEAMGKRDVDLPGLGSAKVKSEQISATRTEQYQKKSQGQVVTVPPEGRKFKGYGVQVFTGDKLLSEYFEPSELKGKIGSGFAEPAGKKKGKKKYN